jgi:hypothetical protein
MTRTRPAHTKEGIAAGQPAKEHVADFKLGPTMSGLGWQRAELFNSLEDGVRLSPPRTPHRRASRCQRRCHQVTRDELHARILAGPLFADERSIWAHDEVSADRRKGAQAAVVDGHQNSEVPFNTIVPDRSGLHLVSDP